VALNDLFSLVIARKVSATIHGSNSIIPSHLSMEMGFNNHTFSNATFITIFLDDKETSSASTLIWRFINFPLTNKRSSTRWIPSSPGHRTTPFYTNLPNRWPLAILRPTVQCTTKRKY
jgi:hypothetical protein